MKIITRLEKDTDYWQVVRDLKHLTRALRDKLQYWEDTPPFLAQDVNGIMLAETEECEQCLEGLISDICSKFGLSQKNEQNENESTFEGWEKAMKEKYWKDRYEKIVCSACPYGIGWRFMEPKGTAPCKWLIRNPNTYYPNNFKETYIPSIIYADCARTLNGRFTQEELRQEILRTVPNEFQTETVALEYPERIWEAFLAKQAQLRQLQAEQVSTEPQKTE